MRKYKHITANDAKKELEGRAVFIREVTTEDGEVDNILSITIEISGKYYLVRCPTDSVAEGVFRGTV